MIEHVLLSLRTGELLLGWKVSLSENQVADTVYQRENHTISIVAQGPDLFDGWVCYHPEMSEMRWWMNREWVEKEFEDLGGL